MYVPAHFAADDPAVHELLSRPQAADLVTMTSEGLVATFLPFVFAAGVGERGALLGHLARTNDQWCRPVVGEALVIVHGPDAYVTPNWYASKAEHGGSCRRGTTSPRTSTASCACTTTWSGSTGWSAG